MKKNYRLRDLLLDSDSLELLNEIANQLKMRNSDLARLLLQQELLKIKLEGFENFKIAVIGIKSKKEVKK